MVLARYPGATFDVAPSYDEPRSVDLLAYVEVEDMGEVLDLVIDRVVTMQVEEGLPVHVVPLRPLTELRGA